MRQNAESKNKILFHVSLILRQPTSTRWRD